MSADLAAFLLARLDERAAFDFEIHTFDCTYFTMGRGEGWCTCGEPERVLADVEAKRALVAFLDPTDAPEGEGRFVAERALRLLALPYAKHPDYQPGWRP